MVNRTGTYVAFDGLGETDPTKSDFKYYATLQAWAENKDIEFNITNSHEKASAVRDTSKKATLEKSIMERLRGSKNMLVVLSDDTRNSGSMLSFEIEKAVDLYELPLIIAYVGYEYVINVDAFSKLWNPKELRKKIEDNVVKAIHIPFKKEPILDAINQFTVNSDAKLTSSKNYYNLDAYKQWGLFKQ